MKIKEALQNLVYLHMCEQEGIESGMPTSNQWFKAVEDAEEALRKEQEQEQKNISSWSALTNLDYLRCNNGSLTGDISSWPVFVIDAVQRAISESIIEYISKHPTEQPSNTRELSAEEIIKISEKYANEYGGSMFGLAYKSFRAGIEYIIKNRKE